MTKQLANTASGVVMGETSREKVWKESTREPESNKWQKLLKGEMLIS